MYTASKCYKLYQRSGNFSLFTKVRTTNSTCSERHITTSTSTTFSYYNLLIFLNNISNHFTCVIIKNLTVKKLLNKPSVF